MKLTRKYEEVDSAVRDRLRAMLGEERFAAAWDAGRALERDTVVARSQLSALSRPPAIRTAWA
jgi:hypothetical protein